MSAPDRSVLLHLLPADVLLQARELARRFEEEERFRLRVLAAWWWAAPLFLACAMASGLALLAAVAWVVEQAGWTQSAWRLLPAVLGALGWLAVNALCLYRVFRRIGTQAG